MPAGSMPELQQAGTMTLGRFNSPAPADDAITSSRQRKKTPARPERVAVEVCARGAAGPDSTSLALSSVGPAHDSRLGQSDSPTLVSPNAQSFLGNAATIGTHSICPRQVSFGNPKS